MKQWIAAATACLLISATAVSISAVMAHAAASVGNGPYMEISVKIDLAAGRVEGTAEGTVPQGSPAKLLIPDEIEVTELAINGKEMESKGFLDRIPRGNGFHFKVDFKVPLEKGAQQFAVMNGWTPLFSVPARYSLSAVVPKGLTALSEADDIEVKKGEKEDLFRFSFRYPRQGLSLVVGKYLIQKMEFHGVSIETYLFPKDRDLARLYLQKGAKYIELYSKLIGPYPYRRFAVVENSLPTGYGLPTYTLLGRDVIRLPFIPDTSLAHEIVHSWFGNGVYVTPEGSNWCEGIATYLSDYLLKERRGQGAAYRHQMLQKLNSYLPRPGMTLEGFTGQRSRRWRVVGYEKCALFFHTIRREIGDESFWKGLSLFFDRYKYREAGWNEIRISFQEAAGRDLAPLFSQWLKSWRLPEIRVEKVEFWKESK